MKKVKIMLLSLTLFAVVGGALAFKATLDEDEFCTTNAFQSGVNYYCSYKPVGQETIYTECGPTPVEVTNITGGVLKVCTTTPDPISGDCPITCPNTTSVLPD